MDRRQERKDSAQRRQAWRMLAITAVSGVALLGGWELWLRHIEQASRDEPGQALRQVAMAALLINLVIAVLAGLVGRYLLDWSRQVREQGQWPPAGLQLPGGKPVKHGEEARRIASRLRWAGAATLAFGALLALGSAWRWMD